VLAVALVLVWGCQALSGQRRAAVHLGVFVVTLFLVLLPWMARNYRLMGVFLPTTTAGPYNVFIGWNPWMLDMYEARSLEEYGVALRGLHVRRDELYAEHRALPYWERAVAFQREGVRYVGEHPGAAFRLWLYKFRHYMSPGVSSFRYPWPLVLASWVWETSLFGLALVGLWRGWSVAPVFRTVALLAVAGSWLIHSLINVEVRYRVPFVEPLALLYAGSALGAEKPATAELHDQAPRGRA